MGTSSGAGRINQREIIAFALGFALAAALAWGRAAMQSSWKPKAPLLSASARFDDEPPALDTRADARGLAEQLHDLERRKVALETKVTELERMRAEVARELTEHPSAPAGSADAAPARSRYDLTKADWANMAKTASIRYCLPGGSAWAKHTTELEELGLGPADAEALDGAYARSRERLWQELAPLCAQLSDAGAPDSVMPLALCAQSLLTTAQMGGADAFKEARQEVAEIRAGLRPNPPATVAPPPIVQALLAITGEADTIVNELAPKYGPDEARRIVYRDHGCVLGGGIGD